MPDIANELEKIIQKAAIDGALTEDAVAQFHSIVTERDALKTELATSIDARDALRKERDDARELRDAYKVDLDAWATREADLKDREEKCTRLECESEFHKMRVDDHKQMFATVFKGVHMRRQVVTPGHAGHVDQYGNVQNQGWSEKHDVEDQE